MMLSKTDSPVTLNREEMEAYLQLWKDSKKELSLLVTGFSMSPTLRDHKDRVLLVSPQGVNVRKLDLVLFRRPDGKYVLHRIIQCCLNNTYLINGDAQLWTETIQREQICAVARTIIRKGRNISCNGLLYRGYSCVWVWLKPFRGLFIALYQRIKKLRELSGQNNRFRKQKAGNRDGADK